MIEYLYGRNPIYESLRASRRKFKKLYILDSVKKEKGQIAEILNLAYSKNIPINPCHEYKLKTFTAHAKHQGIVLETTEYPYLDLDQIISNFGNRETKAFILILDLLQDPQNVGSLLRTAEAVGVDGIVIQKTNAVGIIPSVVSASSGAVEHLAVSHVPNISQAIKKLQDNGLWIYGLDSCEEASEFSSFHYSGPIAVVVGSEGEGLRRLVKENCDEIFRLPMVGKVASLNASVAASVFLYKVFETRLKAV